MSQEPVPSVHLPDDGDDTPYGRFVGVLSVSVGTTPQGKKNRWTNTPGSPFARRMEAQILDNGFNVKGKNEWYTTHGDVFPVFGATGDLHVILEVTDTGQPSLTAYRRVVVSVN